MRALLCAGAVFEIAFQVFNLLVQLVYLSSVLAKPRLITVKAPIMNASLIMSFVVVLFSTGFTRRLPD